MEGECGELVFLRYAHPVINYCNDINVDADELARYTEILKTGRGGIDKGRLEQLFPEAVKHLESWREEDVRDYWLRGHNEVQDVKVNPLCQVYLREVSNILPVKFYEVCRIGVDGMKNTSKSYINLNVGDKVAIHAFQVAEKLTPALVERYSSVLK